MSTASVPRPPFDPEFDAILTVLVEQMPPITAEGIPAMREMPLPVDAMSEESLAVDGLTRRDVTITGYEGAEILATVVARSDHTMSGPGIFHIHGGGMIAGNRLVSADLFKSWILDHDAVFVTVEYRLAPEFPDPYPVEDCYAGLVWTAEHAAELGIDPDRLLIAGMSAGGGLAAGTALLARDRRGPALIGQALLSPMLDDRDRSVSTLQYDGEDAGPWNRSANRVGWGALLGDRRGTDEVSIYAAPARATDLSGLPPAFIECGSAEVFRDEDVAYATALWAAGVQAELHVWAGGFHGFDQLAAHTAIGQATVATRKNWADRMLG